MMENISFAPTFTKRTRKMIRKFAMLAVAAALIVGCGGSTDEKNMDANAMTDSAMKMLDKAAADMKAAGAMVDSAAVVVDSAAAAVDAAATKAPQ
mgnify:CR=1 FL=1